jgi:hypothetical protein
MSLKDKIALIYKNERLTPEPTDVFIMDARNDNVSGPYTNTFAHKLAYDLSMFATKGMFPMLADVIQDVRGPFYVINQEGRTISQ